MTNLDKGQNEAVFSIQGTQIHLLDENPDFGLIAPKEADPKPVWINVVVSDIAKVHAKALTAGCRELQSVREVEPMGVSHSLLSDPYGHLWMLHQVHRDISFAKR